MEIEKVGEIFLDGRIINVDSASKEVLDSALQQLNTQKENIVNKFNKILSEI